VLERRAAIQPQTSDAHHGELDRQHIALLAGGIVAGRAMDRPRVEPRRLFGAAVLPQADRVLAGHVHPPINDNLCAISSVRLNETPKAAEALLVRVVAVFGVSTI
jgi:hypothetical protein